MPNQAQVLQTILSAQLIAANKTNANGSTLSGGGLKVSWSFIDRIHVFTQAVLRQYNLGDYVSPEFLTVYDCLVNMVGLDTTVNTIDPNFQNPEFIIGVTTPFAPIQIVRTQNNLIDAGGGNWYLPFVDNNGNPFPSGAVPIFIEIDGIQLNGYTLDTSTIPARIYGFPNNDPQTIVVTIIGAPAGPTPPPPATQVINWGWFASDPYVGIDTATFLFTGNIPVNPVSYTLNFGTSATNQWLAVAELATNTIKTSWFNTVLNYGTIPDSVFRSAVVIGSIRYYVSRIPVVLQTGQYNLTLTE